MKKHHPKKKRIADLLDAAGKLLPKGEDKIRAEYERLLAQWLAHAETNPAGFLPIMASAAIGGMASGMALAATSKAINNPEGGYPTRKEIQTATRAWETFHQGRARSMRKVKVPVLEGQALTFLGNTTEVSYFSPKWDRKSQSRRVGRSKRTGQHYRHSIESSKSSTGRVWFLPDKGNPKKGTVISTMPAKLTEHGIEDVE